MPDTLEQSRVQEAPDDDAPHGAPPPRASRRTLYIASAVGLGLIVGLGAAWVWRAPLAAALIQQNLSAVGVESDFQIARLEFAGAELTDLRLGSEEAPDLTIASARVGFAWAPLPRLTLVHLEAPRLRARVSEEGVTLGQLDAFLKGGARTDGGAGLPRMRLEIVDGRADVATPFGAMPVAFQSWGRIGTDFAAVGTLAPMSQTANGATLTNAEAALAVRADNGGLNAELEASAEALARAGLTAQNARLAIHFAAPVDLSRGALRATFTANEAGSAGVASTLPRLDLTLDSPERLIVWQGAAMLTAESVQQGDALRASGPALAANIALDTGRPFALDIAGRLSAPNVTLTSEGRAQFARAWPELGALPVGPLSLALRDALFAAARDARVEAPFTIAARDERMTFAINRPVEINGAGGARIALTPRAADSPLLLVDLASGAMNGAGRLSLSGGALPTATLDVTRFAASSQTPFQMAATLAIPDYRARNAAISAPNATLTLAQEADALTVRLTGPAKLTGPLGGGAASVTDLEAPFDLAMSFGQSMRVANAGDRCIPARFGALNLPGLTFRNGAAPLCAEPDGFFATSAQGAVSGGVTLAPIAFTGHMQGAASQRATLNAPRATIRFGGTNTRLTMDAALETPALSVALAPDHTVNVRGEAVTAQMIATGGTWSAEGAIANGVVDDATLPANITDFNARFRAEPRGNEAVIRFTGGAARITDRAPANAPSEDRIAAFRPVLARDIEATLEGGRLAASGNLVLEDGGQALGAFTASHIMDSGIGVARVANDALVFDARLQPDDLSALSRSVVANVRGGVGYVVNARWTATTFAADARFNIANVSLSSATLPIIEGVTGEIVFDDLLLLTTPPDQRLAIETINPGIAVHNGVVQFQMREGGRIAIERAQWPFAGGALAVAPTTITLGAEETRFSLTLADVDVATLLAELNVPDLVATGTVGGQFPLVLTEQSARIENGQLSASPGGGTISYAGSALADATGAARLAFGALTSFRYDNLTLELNGDLAGDLVTAINFRGANRGNLDLGGGPLNTSVAGVPFVFNVRVTAPFRQLGDMAAGAFDPRRAIEQAGQTLNDAPAPEPGAEAPAPVDPPAPANE